MVFLSSEASRMHDLVALNAVIYDWCVGTVAPGSNSGAA